MRIIIVLLILGGFLYPNVSHSQDLEKEYPEYIISTSVYCSLLPLPVGLSIDVLKFNGRAYNGLTLGASTFILHSYIYGPHLAYTRLVPKKRGYFETKVGFAYFFEDLSEFWIESNIWPVISIGYRFQETESRLFFRVHISTGFIGIGLGLNLN